MRARGRGSPVLGAFADAYGRRALVMIAPLVQVPSLP
eukprot:SAG11_NODE_20438_length_445_cov_0.745665_2_plen_36_part_01